MKKITTVLTLSLLLSSGLYAHEQKSRDFSKKASNKAELVQEGQAKKWCKVCGMNLKMFYKTSHTAHTKDGKATQYCSIRCLSVDNKTNHTNLEKAQVVDVKSQKLIPAKSAFYVVGSKVQGTMSKVSKLAFAKKEDAQNFAKKMGGYIKTFDEAYALAKASLEKDMAMMSKKRAKMMYPMGKKIFEKKCQKDKFDLSKYKNINELKPDIFEYCDKKKKMEKSCDCGKKMQKKEHKQTCPKDKDSEEKNHKNDHKKMCKQKSLKEKQAQAVALYLWDVVKNGKKMQEKNLHVKKDAKCPVCGMFVKKYPRWATKIKSENKSLYFDGVKDMAKYLKEPKKYDAKASFKAKKVIVTDYYKQSAIDGKKAFYVFGSDVFGPMGKELIPFEKQMDAQTFLKDHKGKSIITLDKITPSLLCQLDGKECE